MTDLTCRELIDFLDDYVEGNQPSEIRADFERHLSQCKACRDYVKTYRDTIAMTRATSPASTSGVPKDLIKAILNARPKSN